MNPMISLSTQATAVALALAAGLVIPIRAEEKPLRHLFLDLAYEGNQTKLYSFYFTTDTP